ncbi:MAG TPA: hypothetical protein VG326_21630 [Tepidisphaeraceae bacterium]|nr:hypothetical protein [Tepidisphaeraceae bacterium]
MKTESPTEPSSRSDSQKATRDADADSRKSRTDAFHDAAVRFREIREYVAYYIAIKTDEVKLAVRNVVLYTALGVVALLATGAAVVAAVVLLLVGLAGGIGNALGGMQWLGDVIVGVGVVVVIVVVAMMAMRSLTKASHKLTVEKYEARKREQRHEFGHNVRQPAGESNE